MLLPAWHALLAGFSLCVQEPNPYVTPNDRYSSFDVATSNTTLSSTPPPSPPPVNVPAIRVGVSEELRANARGDAYRVEQVVPGTAPPGNDALTKGVVKTYYDPNQPELPIHIYRAVGDNRPLQDLNVLVLGTGADAKQALEYGIDVNGKYVVKDDQGNPRKYDVIIAPALHGEPEIDLLKRVAPQNFYDEAKATQQSGVLLAAMKAEFGTPADGGPLVAKSFDMHSNGTSVATPVLASGQVKTGSIGVFGPAMGYGFSDLQKLYGIAGDGTNVRVYADIRDIIASGSGSIVAGLGTLTADVLGREYGPQAAWLAAAAALQKKGFQLRVIDSGNRPGLDFTGDWLFQPHLFANYAKAIRDGKDQAPDPALVALLQKLRPRTASAFAFPAGPDPEILEYLHKRERDSLAQKIAEDINSGQGQHWVDLLKGQRQSIGDAYKVALEEFDFVRFQRGVTIKDLEDRGNLDKLLDAVIQSLKVTQSVVKADPNLSQNERWKWLLNPEFNEWLNAADKASSAKSFAEAEGHLLKIWEAVKIGGGAASDAGIGTAILEPLAAVVASGESMFNVWKQFQDLRQLGNLSDRDRALLDYIAQNHDRMKALVDSWDRLRQLAERAARGEKITLDMIRDVLPGGMLDGLFRDHKGAEWAVQDRIVVAKPLEATLPYEPAGSKYLFDLQTRKLPPYGSTSGRRTPRGGSSRARTLAGAQKAAGALAGRRTMGPKYASPGDPKQGDVLRRMYDRDRLAAERFRSLAGWNTFAPQLQDRPCPGCGGRGRLDLSARMAGPLNMARQLLTQAEQQMSRLEAQVISTPDVVRDSKNNVIADNRAWKASLRQQIANWRQQAQQARTMLNSVPKDQPCPTCGGSGRMRFK